MGVSKTIATILILIIVIALIALAWMFISGVLTGHIGKAIVVEDCFVREGYALISIRNIGTEAILLPPQPDTPFDYIRNLAPNPNFEIDNDGDGIPDGWGVTKIKADVILVTDLSNSMQACMDNNSDFSPCPQDGKGIISDCKRELPCSTISNCSTWLQGKETGYCVANKTYTKTTYKKVSEADWTNCTYTLDSDYCSDPNYPNVGVNYTLYYTSKENREWELCNNSISALRGDDVGTWYNLPWNFTFYGKNYTRIYLTSNGVGWFELATTDYTNTEEEFKSRAGIYPFWDDLRTDGSGEGVYICNFADRVVISWETRCLSGCTDANFQAILYKNGEIRFNYGIINGTTSSTVGISKGDNVSYIHNAWSSNGNTSIFSYTVRPDCGRGATWLTSCNASYPYQYGNRLIGCSYESSCVTAEGICTTLGKIYSGNYSFGPIVNRASCLPGECDVGDVGGNCIYINRTTCGVTACNATYPNDMGDRTEYSVCKSSCLGGECATGYCNCAYYNHNLTENICSCTPTQCPPNWYYQGCYTSTTNRLTCSSTECDVGDAYQNCIYINRTSCDVGACNETYPYDQGDKNESSVWRDSCLSRECIEGERNKTACVVEATSCGQVPGYFTCDQPCSPSCAGGQICCCVEGYYEYLCIQKSDYCCATKLEKCRQYRDYCCELRQCTLYSDYCCETKLEKCQAKSYECCDKESRCCKQKINCCANKYTCEVDSVQVVETCTPGYSNGEPNPYTNNCNTEYCGLTDQCFFCENVRIRLAKKLDKDFVEDVLVEDNRMGLVAYGSVIASYVGLTNAKEILINSINAYDANAGQTCISCAINKSIELLKDSPNAKFIVLMSDGEANRCLGGICSIEAAKTEAINLACQANQTYGIRIYTIGFGEEAGSETLEDIANCGNGKFYYGTKPEELAEIYEIIAGEIAAARDSVSKVYGGYSMKIEGDQDHIAVSDFIAIDPNYTYILSNYLKLSITQGDFYIQIYLYDSSYSEIGHINVTDPPFSSGWEGFKKKIYLIDFSDFTDARYVRIVYRWWHPTLTPSGTVWADDVFLGPPLYCEDPSAKDIQKCKEITVRKISGIGDVYPYFSAEIIPAGSYIYLKDSNCLVVDCNYIISSPSGSMRVFCYKG